jgi:peptidase E
MLTMVSERVNKPINQLTIAFIGVAGEVVPKPKGPEDDNAEGVYHGDQAVENFRNAGCTVIEIDSTYNYTQACILIKDVDAIYVEGGNASYLAWWLETTSIGKLITYQIYQGMPYIGSSAGSMVLGCHVCLSSMAALFDKRMKPFTPNSQPERSRLIGLNIVTNAVIWPHYKPKGESWLWPLVKLMFITRKLITIPDGEYRLL